MRRNGSAEQHNSQQNQSQADSNCDEDSNSFIDSLFLSENNFGDTNHVSMSSPDETRNFDWSQQQQQPTTLQESLQQQQQDLMRQILWMEMLMQQSNANALALCPQSHEQECHITSHQTTLQPTYSIATTTTTTTGEDPEDAVLLTHHRPAAIISSPPQVLDEQRLACYTTESNLPLHCEDFITEEGTTPLTRLFATGDRKDPLAASSISPTNGKKRALMIPHLPLTTMSPSLVIATMGLPPVAKKQAREGQNHRHPFATAAAAAAGATIPLEQPQQVLDRLLQTNGLPTGYRFTAVEAKYDTLPTPLQLASYGTAVLKAVHMDDVATLDKLLKAGLSPNACNQFRDSVLDYVCKNAKADIFHCLVRNHAELRVCDGFGRTPLSYCAWSNVFCESIVKTILDVDPQQLFQEDKHRQTPMEVISSSASSDWIDFLTRHQDVYLQKLPKLQSLEHRVQLRDPLHALSIPVAQAVSSGRIAPNDIAR